jgi:hypothetical protein
MSRVYYETEAASLTGPAPIRWNTLHESRGSTTVCDGPWE